MDLSRTTSLIFVAAQLRVVEVHSRGRVGYATYCYSIELRGLQQQIRENIHTSSDEPTPITLCISVQW